MKKYRLPLKKIVKPKTFFTMLSLLLFILIYFIYLNIRIYQYSHQKVPKDLDYVIVLGAKVKPLGPSLSLQNRIDAAVKYLKKNPQTVVVATGGQGDDEHIAEAFAIKEDLIKQGINESRIVVEDKSTSTMENFTFSMKKVNLSNKKIAIVTNDFHIFRSVKMAQKLGLECVGISSPTPKIAILKSYLREYFAITTYYLRGDISIF
ncbi:MAG: hypothetical protein K0R71_418 [Bacillales bacterium]|jgi:uncharacterized SAM-binding protein YcdF (DUF218 family)|nr:hypothetical protein [Bacillales bacterium]